MSDNELAKFKRNISHSIYVTNTQNWLVRENYLFHFKIISHIVNSETCII